MVVPTLKQVQNELARRSFAEFVQQTVNFPLHSWQREHLCPILERAQTERGLRIAIHKPPQYGGSVIVSQRLPAWLIGNDPRHRVGLACYNETHATGFGEVIRDILNSERYQEIFPRVVIKKDAPAGRFMTTIRQAQADAQPSFLAMGLLSGFTGKGLDTLIVDDPYASADDARSETINERVWRWWVATTGVRIPEEANVIVMFHRYHEDDFAGRLLQAGKFEHIRFPAIADENEDHSDPTGRSPGELLSPMRSMQWLSERKDENPLVFAGQFQGRPRPESGGLFRREFFEIVDHMPRLKRWVRYWDIAVSTKTTNDWTVGALVGVTAENQIVIAHQNRFRKEWPDAQAEIIRQTEADLKAFADIANEGLGYESPSYEFGMEAIGTQIGFAQDLVRKPAFREVPFHAAKSKGDKKAEASLWAARASVQPILLVRGGWDLDGFIARCLSFDGLGTTPDDEQDAVSGAVRILYHAPGRNLEPKQTIQAGSPAFYKALAREFSRGNS